MLFAYIYFHNSVRALISIVFNGFLSHEYERSMSKRISELECVRVHVRVWVRFYLFACTVVRKSFEN